jgi:TetR/AcrR family transcriptional regulator, transcriptional repressor for nem operon
MAPTGSTHDTRQTLLDTAREIMARKGFRAVGLNEVLAQAKVPKGSFYHYFQSKNAFGQAIMEDYFVSYLANMDRILGDDAKDAATRLTGFFESWRKLQATDEFTAGCLVITLGPEAANFSDEMRNEIKAGIDEILNRLERIIAEGIKDESMMSLDPRASAEMLYEMWVGASIMAKISRSDAQFDRTMSATRQHLRICEHQS